MQLHGDERGAAMMVAMMILLMLGFIGVAAISTSVTDMNITANFQHDLQSLYVADAGAEHAYAARRDTVGWSRGFIDVPFANGSYTVTVTDSTTITALRDTVILVSTGTRADAQSTVEVRLAATHAFGWGAFGRESIKLCGGTFTDSYDSDSGTYAATQRLSDGDVGSNGYVDICGSADINGDARTASYGDMDIGGTADVSGDTSTTAPLVIFDPVPQSEVDYARLNSSAPAGLAGNLMFGSIE